MSDDSAPKSRNITTLSTFDTEYSADSVEWCPHEPNLNIFVCGTYQLTETNSDNKKRVGRILLFKHTPTELILEQTINTPAILDQKWCHNQLNSHSVLAVANGDGILEIYRLNNQVQLELLCFLNIKETYSLDELLLLSVDWSTGKYESHEPELVVSDSQGSMHLLKLINNTLEVCGNFQGHSYEAWIAAFYYWDTNVLFSGGDDSLFLKYDRRINSNKSVVKNSVHGAGVTAIHSNKSKEFIIATGSYDERVRLWDLRQLRDPLETITMPGPLWRLKWDPVEQNYLISACMLGGMHIIKAINALEIIESYYEHKNICYGADWCHSNSVQNEFTVGTCSFYDHLLCISKFTIN